MKNAGIGCVTCALIIAALAACAQAPSDSTSDLKEPTAIDTPVGASSTLSPTEQLPTNTPAALPVSKTPSSSATDEPRVTASPSQVSTVTSISLTETIVRKEIPGVTPVATPSPDASSPPVVQAKQDLARRLGTRADQIELVEFQSVTWPDGSLGCPQPGMAYTQVLVEGYLIKLRVADRVYEYHGAGTSPPFLCQQAK